MTRMTDQPIRLCCSSCDREDHDGISEADLAAVKETWQDVHYDAELIAVYQWWNWIGTCPDCIREEAEDLAEARAMTDPC